MPKGWLPPERKKQLEEATRKREEEKNRILS
jgi:hypothetical protein